MSENEKKKWEFIEEQIRKKPFYKKKGFLKALELLGLAVTFGAVSGGVFAVVRPWAENKFGEPTKLVMVYDEEESERETAEEKTDQVSKDGELLSQYQSLYGELSAAAEEMDGALVTVHGTLEKGKWFDEIVEDEKQGTGLIVAMNHYNVYILTDKNITNGARRLKVTMPDGTIADASLQKEDRVTRMAIIRIPYEKLERQTLDGLRVAVFDDTDECRIGEPVIALGVDFMSFGSITSLPRMTISDGTYQKITTNIIGDGDNGGVILNLDGKVIGLLGVTDNIQELELLEGLGIIESQFLLESLSNREVMPYLGITGKEITENLSEGLSMPKGVFIKEVAANSPAMKKGIKTADILSWMDGQEIRGMADYMKIMETLEPGERVKLKIQRQDAGRYKEIEVMVTLGQR